ncbi:hypothetical protein [Paenibacillus odorifer]|uniref:hypothetical protein n=1 Tax=Paenibacillus TaxID=44249 RepID=UPI00096FC4AD|nr:hypothetical protein [Paenibacillus odorifer]OMD02559.1 hypothetical protein BJP46_15770 [Paenibacillus odorifer]
MSTEIKKALLPQDVADTLVELRGRYEMSNEAVAGIWMQTGGGVSIATRTLRKISFDTLMVALFIGYDREMTEEERRHDAIRREWKRRNAYRYDSYYNDGYADGIEFVLGEMGVEITEVNA